MKHISLNGLDVIKDSILVDTDVDFHIEIDRFGTPGNTHFDMHYELEIGIVLSGKVERHYADVIMELERGDIWLTNIWEPHGLTISESPSEVAVFIIDPQALSRMNQSLKLDIDLIAPFFTAPASRPRVKSKEEQAFILDIGRRAANFGEIDSPVKRTLCTLLTLELLSRIQENWSNNEELTSAAVNGYVKINPAFNLIFHSRKLLSTKEAARECGLNKKTFSRIFKSVTGETFSRYALAYRIKSSINDLIQNDSSLKHIAYKWGFTDESHYTRIFNSFFGCNPGEYRNARLQSNV